MWPHQIEVLYSVYFLLLGTFVIMFILFHNLGNVNDTSLARFFNMGIASLWLWIPLYFLRHPLDKLFNLLSPNLRYFLFYIYYLIFIFIAIFTIADIIHSIKRGHHFRPERVYNPIGAQIFWLTIPATVIFISLGYWPQVAVPAAFSIMAGLFFDRRARKKEQHVYSAQREALKKKNHEEFMAKYYKRISDAFTSRNFDLFLKIVKEFKVESNNLGSNITSSMVEFGKKFGIGPIMSTFSKPKWQSYVQYPLDALRELRKQGIVKNDNDSILLPSVEKALLNKRTDIRIETIRALGQVGNHEVMERLKESLVDTDKQIRLVSAEALARLGEEKWKKWVTGSDNDLHRIAGTNDPVAFSLLVIALKSPDSAFCTEAAKALTSMQNFGAAQPLVKAWNDINNPSAKSLLLKALSHIHDADLIKPMFSVLDEYDKRTVLDGLTDQSFIAEIFRTEKSLSVRKKALQKITDETVVADIARSDESELIRAAAIELMNDVDIITEIGHKDKSNIVHLSVAEKKGDHQLVEDILIKLFKAGGGGLHLKDIAEKLCGDHRGVWCAHCGKVVPFWQPGYSADESFSDNTIVCPNCKKDIEGNLLRPDMFQKYHY